MASLFRPVTVKVPPANAEKTSVNGKPGVRWKNRKGQWTIGVLTAGGKVRVRSPVWWIEYTDHTGNRRRERISTDRAAAEYRRAEIVREVERARVGLPSMSASPSVRPLLELAAAYRDHLAAKGRSNKHFVLTYQRICTVLTDCGWVLIRDVTADGWHRWAAGQRADGGLSAESCNHYLRAVRGMLRWVGTNPLASVEPFHADSARVLVRRVLDADTFARLIATTRASTKVYLGLAGPDRAALYLCAARTGLRAGVLAQLTTADIRLDDPLPNIPTTAGQQKSRKAHVAPIAPDLAAMLRGWLEGRTGVLWPGNWHRHQAAAKMLRRDLRAAGIPAVTGDGSYDFHALRSQCGTDLARAGVSLSVAQQFLGHSTPALTAKHYLRLTLEDLAKAAGQLGCQPQTDVLDEGARSDKPDAGTDPSARRKPRR